SQARARSTARSGSSGQGCQSSKSGQPSGPGRAISPASASPAAGSGSVWRAIAQAWATVASRLPSRRSAVLALPLRWPKYTVTAAAPAPAAGRAGPGCRRWRERRRCSGGYPVARRGRDEDTGESLAPGRSQRRREALGVLALATTLAGLEPGRLAKLPVPGHLLPHVAEARRITSHIARKRQLAFLAKQMRREDDEVLDAIRDALDAGGEAAKQETALLHRAEHWRERLLDDGDA